MASVKAGPLRWSARQLRRWSGDALLRRMVDACLAQIRPNADAIAGGRAGPGHVHQLRVGLRRLRAAARDMAPFSAGLPLDWEAASASVFEALGEARDRHVRSTRIAAKLARAGAPMPDLDETAPDDIATLRRLVRGPRFQELLERLTAYARARPVQVAAGAANGLDHLVSRLRKLARQVARGARGFESLPFERQHQVRKRLKRLRYLAEFAAPAFASGEIRAWTSRVSRAQDALGRHVDLVVAARHFESAAISEPRAWFAVGWLRARAKRAARAAHESLVALRRAGAFW